MCKWILYFLFNSLTWMIWLNIQWIPFLSTIVSIIWLNIQFVYAFTSQSKHFCARGVLPAQLAPAPRAKMLRLISKRPNPLNIQSIQGIQSLVKEKSFEYSIKRLISSFWKRGKGIWYIYLPIDLIIRLVRLISCVVAPCKLRRLVALQG